MRAWQDYRAEITQKAKFEHCTQKHFWKHSLLNENQTHGVLHDVRAVVSSFCSHDEFSDHLYFFLYSLKFRFEVLILVPICCQHKLHLGQHGAF